MAAISALPGKAKSAIGSLGSTLKSAGADLIRGFLDGINSMVSTVLTAVENLAGSVVSAIKGALKIGSPSKVMRDEVGVQLGAGLIQGINASKSDVNAAVSSLVSVPNVAVSRISTPSVTVARRRATVRRSRSAT